MSSPREGVNPLRPYYIPPTIGEQTEKALPSRPPTVAPSGGHPSTRYANKARDIVQDIDYQSYLDDSSPSTFQSAKNLVDELLWKYTSVLMSQPFEVAKTILQIRLQDDLGGLSPRPVAPSRTTSAASGLISPPHSSVWDQDPETDSDPDEVAYFTSNAPMTPTPQSRNRRRRQSASSNAQSEMNQSITESPHQLSIKRPDSIFEVISQLWSKEAAWGVWKGTNATFLYTVLQSLLENWSRSLLSALLNVPDLGLKDDVDRLVDVASPYPWLSLGVAAAAAVATGLALAPLDLVRTRLIVTGTSRGTRRTLKTLEALPSWTVEPALVAPTVLNSLVHPILTLSTPLVLRSQFLIDRDLSPTTFSVARFFTSCTSLFVKLPLETVLRRGQVQVLSSQEHLRAMDEAGSLEPIVTPGPYNGVVGTMYTIVKEEGSRAVVIPPPPSAKNGGRHKRGKSKAAASATGAAAGGEVVFRKGQGLAGLWRGWKVSAWGLAGLWVASMAGAGGEGEF
ncbi:mitochondrial carrier domain-containing protein [Microdochium trichocladiopsis]|uniref:Mitochondrial carrier domain-containing protein n=1 Tax=Microdochium trichocladiopsis TaxID=1682393 RepID=A0A9P9BPW9_9PEZI|nr:mitochondrial carrier domain-containing protein [Microdochium trichocladiopsis]KAH7033549.1 mitochondrial carrier domain-containing protein [Microdochium trichocladiopsis]